MIQECNVYTFGPTMEPAETVRPIRGPIPPVFFFMGLLVELALRYVLPVAFVIPTPWHWIGAAIIAAALLIIVLAASQFTRVGTTVR